MSPSLRVRAYSSSLILLCFRGSSAIFLQVCMNDYYLYKPKLQHAISGMVDLMWSAIKGGEDSIDFPLIFQVIIHVHTLS